MPTTAKLWNLTDAEYASIKQSKNLSCPLCLKSGFSLPGLQNHRCKTLPKSRIGNFRYHDRLSRSQIEFAIDSRPF